jgi:Tfp pilus assembly protein PilF
MADAAFFEELIDLYNLNAHPEKANKIAENTLNALLVDNISANKDKDAGHYSDRELAMLYLKLGQLDNARKHAETEHQRRPQNIDACETLAWINYKQQQADKALPLIQTAMRTNYQNPELLVKAGLIYIANGKNADGKQLIEQGLSLKPYMDETLASEAKTVLAK